jgi:hypothetical protein
VLDLCGDVREKENIKKWLLKLICLTFINHLMDN